MIGKLERVPLREVWPHEALDFTCWLEENVEVLNEALGLELSIIEREGRAGSFNVDLRAEDSDGHAVVIENQLERSDHDHLGKVITYLSAFDAQTAIWIVADPRPEHVSAIGWLNESSSADFYMLKVEAVRIGESEPAPLLTLIIGPSEVSREVKTIKQGDTERNVIRKAFWTVVLELTKSKTLLYSGVTPPPRQKMQTGAGRTGLWLAYATRQGDSNIELYIDRRTGTDEENKQIFDQLSAKKAEIEDKFGQSLVWERLQDRHACRISHQVQGGYRDPEDTWPVTAERLVDAMIRLEAALRPHINALEL